MRSQLKGKHHIRYIRQMAMSMWQRDGFQGPVAPYFRAAMSKWRKSIIVSAQKKKLTMEKCIVCRKPLDDSEKEYLHYCCLSCSSSKKINPQSFFKN